MLIFGRKLSAAYHYTLGQGEQNSPDISENLEHAFVLCKVSLFAKKAKNMKLFDRSGVSNCEDKKASFVQK